MFFQKRCLRTQPRLLSAASCGLAVLLLAVPATTLGAANPVTKKAPASKSASKTVTPPATAAAPKKAETATAPKIKIITTKKSRSAPKATPEGTPEDPAEQSVDAAPMEPAENSAGTPTGVKKKTKPALPNTLSFSLGGTSASYQQSGIAPVSAMLVTGKVDYRRQFEKSRWALGLNTFFTVLPISSNLPSGVSLRFVGVNWRLGYRITPSSGPWNIEASFGTYYETMLVSGARFGFQNLAGPQVLLRAARIIRPGDGPPYIIAGYAKYAMMAEQLKLSSLSNRETAFGLSWIGTISGAPVSFMTDYATVDFTQGSDAISLRTFSVSAGYRILF